MTQSKPPRLAPSGEPVAAWHDRAGWKSVKAVLEAFGILGGVIGVAMVAYQLWDAEQTKQVERSLQLVERFNGEYLSEATETLRRGTLDMNEQLAAASELIAAASTQPAADVKAPGFDEGMKRQIAVDLTSSLNPQTRANQAALIRFARFFDETALCVASGLCNKQIICSYLSTYAVEVDTSYRAGLDAINDRSGGNVGEGLQSIILSCKS